MSQDIAQKIAFIIEVDQLKSIFRQSLVVDKSRHENDAEHSWHLVMMAIVLADYANEDIDLLKVIKMLTIHDLVEIDVGDTFAYDEKGHEGKYERELTAAKRIFGLLPAPQNTQLLELWLEFEHRETPESKFAAALDRLHPMLSNYYTQGGGWQKHNIKSTQVLAKNVHIEEGSKALWDYAQQLVTSALEKGYLSE